MPEYIQPKFKQKEWIKAVIPAADRAGISDDNLFFLLSDLLSGNGCSLDEVIISPSTISRIRKQVKTDKCSQLKVFFEV